MQGKPVFEVPQQPTEARPTAPPASHGPKELPEVEVERVECHINGSHMQLSCHIKNMSPGNVELDKIRLLGTVRELDTWLKPGESRECIVFDGPTLNNRNYDDAYLSYKGADGDYVEAYHTVEFRQEPNNTYSVTHIRRSGPLKDI